MSINSDIKTVLELRRVFKKEKFDIIQTFNTKPAYLVPLAYCHPNTKIVRTITGLGTVFMSNSLKYKILRRVYFILHKAVKNRVTHTTFQNRDDQNHFIKNKLVNQKNSSLIFGSGIDLQFFEKFPKEKNTAFTFICVGRLVYEKGIVNFLEAAKKCSLAGHDFRFILVGPLEENSKKLNKSLLEEYQEYVEWLGPRKDIPQLLQQSDVFVLPTFREGFSRVLLEASAMGIPSITTNVPGTREIIRHQREGLLIPVNDSLGLSKAMILIASDKKNYHKFSKNAKKHVQQFSLYNISKAYMNLYSKIYEFKGNIDSVKPNFLFHKYF